MRKQIDELAAKINQARTDYYNGTSAVSDRVFDAWVDELASLDPKNLAVIGIGAEPVSSWEKMEHKIPMGSLNKCQMEEEYQSWHYKYARNAEVLLTLKLDGLSVSLEYDKGKLVRALTRGAGVKGENILSNVARMMGVPLKLSEPISLIARGEILLSKENHRQYFADYSNTRNAASGISRRYDGEGCDKLTVLCYQIFCDAKPCATYEDQFLLLTQLGFQVPTYYSIPTMQSVFDWKNTYQTSIREAYQFDLDGLVIHLNDLKQHQQFGMHNGRPYASIAYKFDNAAKETSIRQIVWQTGSMGRITPVAIVDPVELVGATVERASLYNYGYVQELGLDVGAKVLLERANDVIPRVEEVVEDTGTIAEMPTNCPECGGSVEMQGEYLVCLNTSQCPSQIVGRLKNWIKELNILEWGDTLLERLVESGKVHNVADLYTLTVEDLASIERMGKKSATKCYDLLAASKEVSLEVFLGGLSIPLVGQSTIRLIMEHGWNTLGMIRSKTASDFQQVKGIGAGRAQSLAKGLQDPTIKAVIDQLLETGMTIKTRKKASKTNTGRLVGKTVVFTGTLSRKRDEWSKIVEEAGGIVKGSVSAGTDYLVMAKPDSSSSKAQAARKHGTQLISEADLETMVQREWIDE